MALPSRALALENAIGEAWKLEEPIASMISQKLHDGLDEQASYSAKVGSSFPSNSSNRASGDLSDRLSCCCFITTTAVKYDY